MAGKIVKIPKLSELPLNKGDPHHSAWGLYGRDDQLGTLNRLTDGIVLQAAKTEIKSGTRISLNWALDAQGKLPFFGREAFHKKVWHKKPRVVNDDIWTFNTQSSSQWDGLRHFGYQKEEVFYGGVTMEDIHKDESSTVNGIQAWAEKGIVGRGILLDFHSWRLENHVNYDPFKIGSIPLKYLKATAEAQGTEIKYGDILIIRSGAVQLKTKRMEERH
ncbi:MAG: hypothetical protein M1827_005941 [Pycnora praestabilis]|nr:MAG: hypothetical protein M1827_005941 [Pycnora praestabilis]